MAKRILVVDDNSEIRGMLKEYLTAEGFQVLTARNGQDGLHVARDQKPDCVVLDLMMPEMGGQEFLRIFTAESDTPVLVLTARVEETDKVLGLELGADDYVTKPFSLRELTARIKALLRRMSRQTRGVENSLLRAADITLDRAGHLVEVAGQPVELTPSEFKLLAVLMAAPGRAFSRQDLLEHLDQGGFVEGMERTVDVHIHNLRDKIEPDPAQPSYIETVYGAGYRFTRGKR